MYLILFLSLSPTYVVCRKVMSSVLSVCQFTDRCPCDHYGPIAPLPQHGEPIDSFILTHLGTPLTYWHADSWSWTERLCYQIIFSLLLVSTTFCGQGAPAQKSFGIVFLDILG